MTQQTTGNRKKQVEGNGIVEQYKLTMKAVIGKYEKLCKKKSPKYHGLTVGKLSAYRDSLEIFKEAFGR